MNGDCEWDTTRSLLAAGQGRTKSGVSEPLTRRKQSYALPMIGSDGLPLPIMETKRRQSKEQHRNRN
jgi:hypothetical protein